MSERLTIRLFNAQQARADLPKAWTWIKAMLLREGAKPVTLELREETRSGKQNRYLHAMLGDISKQTEWAGKKRDTDTWKRLLTAAWLRARGESVELLPALDGHGVDVVFRHTSKLTRAECAELCDFIAAWAVEHGVELRDAQQWMVDAETGEIT